MCSDFLRGFYDKVEVPTVSTEVIFAAHRRPLVRFNNK
jgi:hypothetical protein